MDAQRALDLLTLFATHDIPVWLDGGWAVDALLGIQTRTHDDLDLVACMHDSARIVTALGAQDYTLEYAAPDSCFVLVDTAGHQVDVHPAVAQPNGDAVYRMENGDDWIFPAAGFGGVGRILGREVPCLTPEVVLVNHTTGYELDAEHERDVAALSERYDLPLPEYARAPQPAPRGSA